MPVKRALTRRNICALNWRISNGRRAESPMTWTKTASWERSSWNSEREPLEQRMRTIKERIYWTMKSLLELGPEGKEIVRSTGVRFHASEGHICSWFNGRACGLHADDVGFWKNRRNLLSGQLLALRIRKFGPRDGSSTLYMEGRQFDAIELQPQARERMEQWVRDMARTGTLLGRALSDIPSADISTGPARHRKDMHASRSSRRLAGLPPELGLLDAA